MGSGDSYLRMVFLAAIAIVLAFVFGIVIGRGSFEAVRDWQTLISALVACAAVGVAYVNVSRQVRMNVILREEKIINDDLPGLIDAVRFLALFNFSLDRESDPKEVGKVLENYGFRTEIYALRSELAKRLPQTAVPLRSNIASAISSMIFHIDVHAEYTSGNEDDEESDEDRASAIASTTAGLQDSKKYLENLERDTGNRIAEWTDRLPKLRGAIDRYIA